MSINVRKYVLKSVKKQFDDGPAEDTILSPRDKLKVKVFFPIIDQLSASLRYRLAAYIIEVSFSSIRISLSQVWISCEIIRSVQL